LILRFTKLFALVIPVIAGLAAAQWTSLALWVDMKEGLIAFLGFLAASLVQVMPVTANFLQSDRLNPSEAEKLTISLTRQQHYWLGLLAATIFSMVMVILGAALKARLDSLTPIFLHATFLEITWEEVIVFVLVASFSFVLVKMLGLFEGILSLHSLRGELVLSSAKRSAAEKIAILQKSVDVATPILPEGYGQIVSSPSVAGNHN
jgi:hypothetical protein